MEKITLGSASPRRAELIKKLNIEPVIKPAEIDEIIDQKLSVEENAKKIALDKLIAVKKENPEDNMILTADTFIAYNGEIMGKPMDKDDAFRMLSTLSGNTHQVLTGVSVYSKLENRTITEVDITDVKFKILRDSEIEFYLSFNEWQDAAGAYQIQNAGEFLIEKINGSYSSVMGLPISRIYDIFLSLKFINPVT